MLKRKIKVKTRLVKNKQHYIYVIKKSIHLKLIVRTYMDMLEFQFLLQKQHDKNRKLLDLPTHPNKT